MDTHNNVVMLDQHRNEKPKQPEQETDDVLAAADQFLDANPMREVLRLGCYFLQRADGAWFAVRPGHLKGHFPEWSQSKFRVAVTMRLQERGWTYNDVTYTFLPNLPSDMLNLLDRSGWLQPATGDCHWLFDVLVQSLGGNKIENMEHIKHVLAYKYLHPEAYTLPCLMIHGEGGVGKNVLVNHVLGIIFDGQTTSTASANVIGNFNSTLKGKACLGTPRSPSTRRTSRNMTRTTRLCISYPRMIARAGCSWIARTPIADTLSCGSSRARH
jgi:hypothetical protein